MRAFLVTRDADGKVAANLTTLAKEDLPAGDVLIRVDYSSLNYKDALAMRGHPGVVARFPHVPGIDAAGVVEKSTSAAIKPGDEVIVRGYLLGSGAWGAYCDFIRVPAQWVMPLPASMSRFEAMALGTAGFTAAMCVDAILARGVRPAAGEIVVTGATGGVGSIAVAILAKLGYRVVASTGKADAEPLLRLLGAERIVDRRTLVDASDKPLLSQQWASAVDTVGGETLSTLLRSTKTRGVVAACGLVGGIEVPTSVYPFLLRGIRLEGIESGFVPDAERDALWRHLGGDWRVDQLATMTRTVTLEALPPEVDAILAGQITGRVVVQVNADAPP
jgi:putative YhdH/YhfP family quinone oxidoreductase